MLATKLRTAAINSLYSFIFLICFFAAIGLTSDAKAAEQPLVSQATSDIVFSQALTRVRTIGHSVAVSQATLDQVILVANSGKQHSAAEKRKLVLTGSIAFNTVLSAISEYQNINLPQVDSNPDHQLVAALLDIHKKRVVLIAARSLDIVLNRDAYQIAALNSKIQELNLQETQLVVAFAAIDHPTFV
jgi:hypothetical protein